MDRVRPFYCGTQYADWVCNNCDSCAKAAPPDIAWDDWEGKACEIEKALSVAAICEGHVPAEIADRMGYTCQLKAGGSIGYHSWPCREWKGKDGATAWSRLTADQRKKYGWPETDVEQVELDLKGA